MEETEKEEALREQCAAAFEKHSDELFRHARMRLPDRERALELTQEAFLRTWQYAAKGGVIKQYRAFLYRTLHNLIIDEYRKHKTESLDALLEEGEEGAGTAEGKLLRDETDALEDAMIRFEGAEALAALANLHEAHRTVLILRYVDGLSPREIADCLGEKENNISVRIHRALHKLRELVIPQNT